MKKVSATQLSSEAFQRVINRDSLIHPLTGIEVKDASQHVRPMFELMPNLYRVLSQ